MEAAVTSGKARYVGTGSLEAWQSSSSPGR
ncbi:hypothetical protein [Streptomyces albidoflavus]